MTVYFWYLEYKILWRYKHDFRYLSKNYSIYTKFEIVGSHSEHQH